MDARRRSVNAGVHVVITARTEADGRQAEADFRALGMSVVYLPQDVSSEADWERVDERDGGNAYGRLDFLVNNAGISSF